MLIEISWEEARGVVESDVTAVMHERVPVRDDERDGFALGAPFTMGAPARTTNGGDPIEARELHDVDQMIHVVPWAWTGVDSVGLFELGPTRERITVHGVTFVTKVAAYDDEKEDYQLYRYIDWLDVFSQAGISIATRPIVDARGVFNEDMLRENPELDEAYKLVERRESGGRAKA